jgi:hypothetical protein
MWRGAFRIERRAEEEPACLAHDFVRRIWRCICGGTTAKSTAAVLRRCTRSRGQRITTSTQQAGTAAAGRGRGQGSGRGQGEGVLASFCVVQLVAQPDALIQELRERHAQPSLLCGTTVEAKTCRTLQCRKAATDSNCKARSAVGSSPVQSSPFQSSPVQSSPVQSSPVQSTAMQSSPVKSSPI